MIILILRGFIWGFPSDDGYRQNIKIVKNFSKSNTSVLSYHDANMS